MLAAGPPRALIVDDDAPCRELAAHAVQREGLAVVEASSGTRALTLARAVDVSVVVLDLGLPDRDGLGVLRELREITDAPTLVVSADGRVSSRVAALRLGADDYLVKPASLAELGARVVAALRRATPREPTVVQLGDCTVDLRAHEVRRGSRTIELTPREHALLRFLVTHPRRVFSRARLLDAVWGDPTLTPDTVTEHVRTLRNKLGEPACRAIVTVRGVGYRFDPST